MPVHDGHFDRIVLAALKGGFGVFLVLGWKVAGWWGLDRWLLTRLGTPWLRGRPFTTPTARPEPQSTPIPA